MLVVYSGCGDEVIVCELKEEDGVLKEYFEEGSRDLDDYDRTVVEGAVVVSPRTTVDFDRIVS